MSGDLNCTQSMGKLVAVPTVSGRGRYADVDPLEAELPKVYGTVKATAYPLC